MINLNDHRKNIYQYFGVRPTPCYGEDGVITKIFETIGVSNPAICIEFGELRSLGTTTRAYKIKYLAKSLYFSTTLDFKSKILNILDILKISLKLRNIKYLSFIFNLPFKQFADLGKISHQIRKFADSQVIDLMVVDIDSFDFQIVREILLSGIHPNVFVVEYNPSLPVNHSYYFERNMLSLVNLQPRIYGASYAAWIKLFEEYDYSLIHISGFCNLFFTKGQISKKFVKPDIIVECTDTRQKVLDFAGKYCLPGFKPSWLDSPYISPEELELFSSY